MNTLIPYLILPTQCEEALYFYRSCFGGQITFLQTNAQTDYQVSDAYQHKVAHAEFKANGIHFYASDGFENDDIVTGNNVALTINFTQHVAQKNVFDRLQADGRVTMPLSQTSINTTLASVIDRYGIHWYLNLVRADAAPA